MSAGFYVDVGLKFPARILRDKLPQWEQDVVTTGSLLHVKLMDAEKAWTQLTHSNQPVLKEVSETWAT